jgi:hypothetical protein
MNAAPVLILAGGTGGHIYPGLALAQVLRQRGVPVHWLGADGGLETRLVPGAGIALSTLAISGLLVESLGGQSVFPPQPAGTWNSAYSGDDWRESAGRDRHRRGLYTFAKRTAPYVTFQLFDAPSREVACTRRDRTNTPLQALALLDDPAFVECALALARRIVRERTGSDAERLEWAFRACTARAPAAKEAETLLKLLRDAREEFADVAKAHERVALLEQGAIDATELAAWASVATVLLNLDDTVVRN